MRASNIQSVSLAGGQVTIVGQVTLGPDDEVKLLHVWLAQPGYDGQAGAGLAIDYLATRPPGSEPFPEGNGKFEVTTPVQGQGAGVVGDFCDGPATVSAIAVVYNNGVIAEVLEWSRLAVLPEAQLDATAQGEAN